MRRRYLTVLLAAIVPVVLAGCVSSSIKPLPESPEVNTPPTSSAVPDYSGTSLVPVVGTTSTTAVQIKNGTSVLRGRVLSGGAPVGGASVRVERLVDDKSASVDVVAGPDGTYQADGLQGGRFRVRAFKPPDATMTAAQVLFVGAGENRVLDLNLDRFGGGTEVRASVSPSPPILGDPNGARVYVTMTSRGVDSGGVARSIPAPGITVSLSGAGGRSVLTANPVVTDNAGRAQWGIQCNALDNQGLTLTAGDGSTYNINVAGCEIPPPTTTTVVPDPSATVPPPA